MHLSLHGLFLDTLCHPHSVPVVPAFGIRRRSRLPSFAAGRVVIGCNLFGSHEAGAQGKRGCDNQ